MPDMQPPSVFVVDSGGDVFVLRAPDFVQTKEKKMNYKDLAERAVWTFVEAATAVLVVTDVSSWEAAGAAGAASVLALVKNVAKQRREAMELVA